MKYIPLLTLLLCCCTIASMGQQQHLLIYDLRGSHFVKIDAAGHETEAPIPENIKEGSAVSLKYIHINPFAFKSATTFQDINHNYQDGLSVIQQGLNSISAQSGSDAAQKNQSDKTTDSLKARVTAKNNLTAKLQKEQEKVVHLDTKLDIQNNIRVAFARIQSDIRIINAIMTLDTIMKRARQDRANDDPDKMKAAIIATVQVFGINGPENISIVFNAAHGDILAQLTNISRLTGELQALNTPDADVKKGLQKEADSLNKIVSTMTDTYTGNNLVTLQTNVGLLTYDFNQLINTPYEIGPGSIGTASGDFLQVSDTLTDNKGNIALSIAPKGFPTYGGTRVDFSLGIGVSIGGNGYQYSLRKNPTNAKTGPDTAVVGISSSNKNKLFQFVPVVCVHWYKTSKSRLQWMLTGGLAPDLSTVANTRVFIGTGLGLPSSNDHGKRIVLNAGISFGYADVLKEKYRGWGDYARFSSVDDTDLTEKAIRIGGFFAITYNLGGSGH